MRDQRDTSPHALHGSGDLRTGLLVRRLRGLRRAVGDHRRRVAHETLAVVRHSRRAGLHHDVASATCMLDFAVFQVANGRGSLGGEDLRCRTSTEKFMHKHVAASFSLFAFLRAARGAAKPRCGAPCSGLDGDDGVCWSAKRTRLRNKPREESCIRTHKMLRTPICPPDGLRFFNIKLYEAMSPLCPRDGPCSLK